MRCLALIALLALPGCSSAPTETPRPLAGAPATAALVEANRGVERFDVPLAPERTHPFRGGAPDTARVTIVAFSRYACDECAAVERELAALLSRRGNAVRVQVRHAPPLEPEAFTASQAAIVAAEAGVFQAANDRLHALGPDLNRAALSGALAQAGLADDELATALARGRGRDDVARDMAVAKLLGASRPPALFVNGRRAAIEALDNVVEHELQIAEMLVRQGVAVESLYSTLSRGALSGATERSRRRRAAGIRYRVPAEGEEAIGPAHARATIVVFGDFGCSGSERAHALFASLRHEYGDELRWVFKHLPRHAPQVLDAHRAAIVAGRHGKFWDMADRLFAQPDDFSRPALIAHARAIGLDGRQFAQQLARESNARLREHQALAYRFGVQGTPTVFLNGLVVNGVPTPARLRRTIDAELARADELLAAGTEPAELYDALIADGRESAPPPDGGASTLATVSSQQRSTQ